MPTGRNNDWSLEEVVLVVEDYFQMLSLDISGANYNKTEHRKALLPKLNGRSEGSIEYKHQNISAVLMENNLPFIKA